MRALTVGSVLATFLVAIPASANPKVVATVAPVSAAAHQSLAWRAPKGCPDGASLKARVEQRLERSLDDLVVGIDIDVERAEGRYVARVDLGAMTVANDVRTLNSKRCSELADAVAVIVARVASDAIAQRQQHSSSHATRAEQQHDNDAHEPRAVVTTAAVDDLDSVEPIIVARAAAPEKPRRTTLGVRISGISGIGVIPQVGLGGELALTLRRDSHLAELGESRWVASAAQFHDGAPAKVDIELDATVARYGWRPYAMPLRAWVAVEVGSMRGAGVKLPSQQLESGRWLAAGTGFGIAWQMTKWARLVGATETMLALERVRFSLGDGIVVYAPAPMSVRFTCGLEVGWQ